MNRRWHGPRPWLVATATNDIPAPLPPKLQAGQKEATRIQRGTDPRCEMEVDLSGAKVELQWQSQDLVIGVLAMRSHEDGGCHTHPGTPGGFTTVELALGGLDPIIASPSLAACFTSTGSVASSARAVMHAPAEAEEEAHAGRDRGRGTFVAHRLLNYTHYA
uniref:Uncharacterized protein n=1 Tax=Oryza nivara TaxID=4536 RepID=A0A0E0HNX0_ORYNI